MCLRRRWLCQRLGGLIGGWLISSRYLSGDLHDLRQRPNLVSANISIFLSELPHPHLTSPSSHPSNLAIHASCQFTNKRISLFKIHSQADSQALEQPLNKQGKSTSHPSRPSHLPPPTNNLQHDVKPGKRSDSKRPRNHTSCKTEGTTHTYVLHTSTNNSRNNPKPPVPSNPL